MNSFIKNAITTFIVVGLIVVTGVFAVFAESNNKVGVHTPSREISVYSPITDMIGIELSANDVQFTIRQRQCEDAIALHQEQIDKILALVVENDISNLQELSTMLQTLQDETPLSCPGGCKTIPVWVIIGGVRHPALLCTTCNKVYIIG